MEVRYLDGDAVRKPFLQIEKMAETMYDCLRSVSVGSSILREIIYVTLQYTIDVLQAPSTAEEWQEVARQFEDKWQYPNCIGAIDGKHIAIRAPPNSGSMFHNYKMFYSIVLMAVVDALYRFLIVDVGSEWSLL